MRKGALLVLVLAFCPPRAPAGQAPGPSPNVRVNRSKAEVEAHIQKEGATPPSWWAAVPVNYPKTLDLTMADPPKGSPWTASKWVSQYFWSVINENPGKWKEGLKLASHLMTLNKDDSDKVNRMWGQMSHLYADCLEDYARAAYSLLKKGDTDSLTLALCYWKLGNKDMAKEVLVNYGDDDTRHGAVVKLWADMGAFDKAIAVAEKKAKEDDADIGYLMAGETCRLAGKFPEALAYYQKVLGVTSGGRDLKQSKARAQASIDAVKVFDALDLKRVPDGTYKSASQGYSGTLNVEVTVKGAKIAGVNVTQHSEKQYYGSLTETPAQIIAKQGVKGVDTFSSATITSEAIINATAKALGAAMK